MQEQGGDASGGGKFGPDYRSYVGKKGGSMGRTAGIGAGVENYRESIHGVQQSRTRRAE
jgi:hypothetical protein